MTARVVGFEKGRLPFGPTGFRGADEEFGPDEVDQLGRQVGDRLGSPPARPVRRSRFDREPTPVSTEEKEGEEVPSRSGRHERVRPEQERDGGYGLAEDVVGRYDAHRDGRMERVASKGRGKRGKCRRWVQVVTCGGGSQNEPSASWSVASST